MRACKVFIGAVILLSLFVFSSPTLWAQFTSEITGTVTDSSGAVVPKATVTIKNVETGIVNAMQTSASGTYRFTALPASVFTVTASAEGFKTTVQDNVSVAIAETRTVNLALEVGASTTQVTVTAAPSPVNTSEGRVSALVKESSIRDLPLVGRNFYNLVVITPGITGLSNGGAGQSYAQANGDIFNAEFGINLNANGQPAESNNFLIDSGSVVTGQVGGTVNVNPNAEDIQEVNVAVNNYSAEYGRSSSALVNVLTKQGTNNWHGTAAWYHTDNLLQSRNVFQTPSGPVFRRNEAAWSLGGPIRKDKTFVFGSMDILKSGVGTGSPWFVTTPAFTDYVETNFPDNISAYLYKNYPSVVTPVANFRTAGNIAGVDCSTLATPETGISTEVGTIPCNMQVIGSGPYAITLPRNGFQWTARVDENFNNDKDRLYYNMNRTTLHKVLFDAPSAYPAFNPPQSTYSMYMNLNETHAFTPTVVNEAAMTYFRVFGDDISNDPHVPGITVTGLTGAWSGLTFGNGWGPNVFYQNNFEWRDVIAFNRGSHNLKAGFTFQRTQANQDQSQVFMRPLFYFENVFDFAVDKPWLESQIGFDPQTGGTGEIYQGNRYSDLGIFFLDDWKVKPNLTLNMGIRWETFGNPSDVNNGGDSNYVFSGNDFTSRITNAGLVRVTHIFDHPDLRGWTPRFGIAWDPTHRGKLSIRAGAGMFLQRFAQQIWDPMKRNPPQFAVASASIFTPPTLPLYTLGCDEQPYCFPIPPGIGGGLNAKNGLNGGKVGVSGIDPNMRNTYSENWFLGIQYSFARDWVMEANYVGSAAHKYTMLADVNRFDGDLIVNRGVLTRLNTAFGSMTYAQAQYNSNYNGGTFAVRNQGTRRGLSFQAAYTYGKAIDYSNGRDSAPPFENLNTHSMRGLSSFDVRQKLAISLLYTLPSHHFGTSFANKLAQGWELAGVTILQSGLPFTVYCGAPFSPVYDTSGNVVGNTGCDYNADGMNYDVPNTPSFGNSKNGTSRSDFITGLFTASDFPTPALGQQGNLGRNTFTGPGFAGTDFSIIKNTKIPWFLGKEGANVQFRSEFFNVFNRVNLSSVDSDLEDSSFGMATSAYGARNIQFALRLTF